MLCSIRASYFLPKALCRLLEAADKSIMFTFATKKMLDVLLVLYADMQCVPLEAFFLGIEENSDSMPSLPLLV